MVELDFCDFIVNWFGLLIWAAILCVMKTRFTLFKWIAGVAVALILIAVMAPAVGF